MKTIQLWQKDSGRRVHGSRNLDSGKVQAPCVVRIPTGGYRLYYTAVGPDKPFPECQGYILSAFSDDGLVFHTEPGIRLAPQPTVPHRSLRILAPSIRQCSDGRWRMYYESRGAADQPVVICSAVSQDMLRWDHEPGIRLQSDFSLRSPRFLSLPSGNGRLYCSGTLVNGEEQRRGILSAITTNGLEFQFEPGLRLPNEQIGHESSGVNAAEVIPPPTPGDRWTMVYSAWQNVSPETVVPTHPGIDVNAVANGQSANFAAASIAVDMAGYRSRIFLAFSDDGLHWERAGCVIEGNGYGGEGPDAIHAEDMSLIRVSDDQYRMYYAACDTQGVWSIVSATGQSLSDRTLTGNTNRSSIAHFTLATRDVARSSEFFQKTLRWKPIHRPQNIDCRAAWLSISPSQELHLIEIPEFEVSPFEREFGRHFAIYYPLAGFKDLKSQLTQQGAELISPERETPFERFFFRDPNGYLFEIVEADHAPEP